MQDPEAGDGGGSSIEARDLEGASAGGGEDDALSDAALAGIIAAVAAAALLLAACAIYVAVAARRRRSEKQSAAAWTAHNAKRNAPAAPPSTIASHSEMNNGASAAGAWNNPHFNRAAVAAAPPPHADPYALDDKASPPMPATDVNQGPWVNAMATPGFASPHAPAQQQNYQSVASPGARGGVPQQPRQWGMQGDSPVAHRGVDSPQSLLPCPPPGFGGAVAPSTAPSAAVATAGGTGTGTDSPVSSSERGVRNDQPLGVQSMGSETYRARMHELNGSGLGAPPLSLLPTDASTRMHDCGSPHLKKVFYPMQN